MEQNRFFTWVWRFNGLAIALAATLIIGLLVWELTRDWRRSTFPTQATEVLNVTPEQEEDKNPNSVQETARFGAPTDG